MLLCIVAANIGIAQSTLTFEQPYATKVWEENGKIWFCDSTVFGGQNSSIDTVNPYAGNGHLTARDYFVNLRFENALNVDGLWIQVYDAWLWSANLNGYDASDSIIYTTSISPDTVYNYENLNWQGVSSIRLQLDWDPVYGFGLAYIDDMVYSDYVITDQKTKTSKNIRTYPNPTSGDVRIELDKIYNRVEVRLASVLGFQIAHYTIKDSQSVLIDMSDLSSGSYIVSIISSNLNYKEILIKK